MLKIGITGGIGSGKTFVSSIFRKLGVPVYHADLQAKLLMNTSPDLINKIKELFSEEAYIHGELNRQLIASKVFVNKSMLDQLNELVHPAVEQDFLNWCSEFRGVDYILKEAAILYESNSYKKLDATIVVIAPESLRIKRAMERDKINRKEVLKRMNNQWPTDKLVELADFIIENDSKKLILPQIIDIDKKIRIEWRNLENG